MDSKGKCRLLRGIFLTRPNDFRKNKDLGNLGLQREEELLAMAVARTRDFAKCLAAEYKSIV